MRFILNIRTQFPGEWSPEHRAAEREKETLAALEHMRNGILRRVFRIPGQYGNYSIWDVQSHEHLHEVLSGMPANAFMTVAMTPVIEAEIERMYKERYGEFKPL